MPGLHFQEIRTLTDMCPTHERWCVGLVAHLQTKISHPAAEQGFVSSRSTVVVLEIVRSTLIVKWKFNTDRSRWVLFLSTLPNQSANHKSTIEMSDKRTTLFPAHVTLIRFHGIFFNCPFDKSHRKYLYQAIGTQRTNGFKEYINTGNRRFPIYITTPRNCFNHDRISLLG